jgi:hypothetical protein
LKRNQTLQRINWLNAIAITALIALSSTLALAQTDETQRGWGARRTLAGKGQASLPVETPESAAPAAQTQGAGGGLLDVLEAQQEARRKALVGAWEIHVAESAMHFPPFGALHVFHQGGTFTEVSNLLPGLSETPAKGIWDIEGDRYLLTFELFVFDEQKQPAGIVRVRVSIKLVNANELVGDTVVDFIAPDGTVELGIDKGPFTGKRIKVMDIK